MNSAAGQAQREPELSIEALEAGAVEAGGFDHEAHVYTAWLYLQRYDTLEAIERYSAALRRLTRKLGVESKYHQTITWFFLLLIAERIARRDTGSWQQFKKANADLFCSEHPILAQYYSGATLGSDLARSHFLMPDIAPGGADPG
jgi:hypothetical protein